MEENNNLKKLKEIFEKTRQQKNKPVPNQITLSRDQLISLKKRFDSGEFDNL